MPFKACKTLSGYNCILQYNTGRPTFLFFRIISYFLLFFDHFAFHLSILCAFWFIWFINQRALYNHALPIGVIGVILHQHWCHHLCTPPPGTWLDIEASYLVYLCTYVPHICTSNI